MNSLAPPIKSSDHSQGSKKAPVTLVEYGDYECPYCADAYAVVKQVQENLGDQVRFVFRNFPLAQSHPHAEIAAEAAGAQGRFWEMHDAIYEYQDSLSEALVMELAAKLDLNMTRFAAEMKAHTYRDRILGDLRGGRRSGVDGTPSFFINGEKFEGELSAKNLARAVLETADITERM